MLDGFKRFILQSVGLVSCLLGVLRVARAAPWRPRHSQYYHHDTDTHVGGAVTRKRPRSASDLQNSLPILRHIVEFRAVCTSSKRNTQGLTSRTVRRRRTRDKLLLMRSAAMRGGFALTFFNMQFDWGIGKREAPPSDDQKSRGAAGQPCRYESRARCSASQRHDSAECHFRFSLLWLARMQSSERSRVAVKLSARPDSPYVATMRPVSQVEHFSMSG